jgi:type II secretory pathway pseudopilin PulG
MLYLNEMKGRSNRYKDGGFTIFEVLIVLGVTMLLFFIATSYVNGRQGQVIFSNSVSDLKTKLVQIINNTTNGNYPSQSFTCKDNQPPNSQPKVTNTILDSGQGTHDKCLFLGKVLDFTTNSLKVFTIVGNAKDLTGTPILSYDNNDAEPIISNTLLVDVYNYQASSSINCQQFSTASVQTYCNPLPPSTARQGALALLYSNNSSNNSELVNIAIPGAGAVNPNFSTAVLVNTINAFSPGVSYIENGGTKNPQGGSQVCLSSGTSNQSALITIGGNGNESSIVSKIFQDSTCI